MPQSQHRRAIDTPLETAERYRKTDTAGRLHILAVVGNLRELPAKEVVHRLTEARCWVFRDANTALKALRAGDRLAVYQKRVGVVAALVADDAPDRKSVNIQGFDAGDFTWVVRLRDSRVFTDRPVPITREQRARLDAFKGKDPRDPGGWFVQAARYITAADFSVLTRG